MQKWYLLKSGGTRVEAKNKTEALKIASQMLDAYGNVYIEME